jgi:hypothetical protein
MHTATPPATVPAASSAAPMAVLGAFLLRRRTLADTARDFAQRFEAGWMLRLVDAERASVQDATGEAADLLHHAEQLLATWRAALADGTVSPAEGRRIQRELRALLGESASHHRHLTTLI